VSSTAASLPFLSFPFPLSMDERERARARARASCALLDLRFFPIWGLLWMDVLKRTWEKEIYISAVPSWPCVDT
jgi:hypothetical protein